ncbi:DUF6283 family protein [Pseudophaeobacter sp. 1A09344]|uniref:DUF6283 family protein n=1 Tax=Pseudophaeobacter sp. 1A09344 TaxID=3098144 RepID=UPI0034D4D5EC
MTDLPRPPKRPCGSCPYRRDVPSGIWHPEEYAKLPPYDGETWEQPPGLFMCHQRDGCICGGWLQTHDTAHLLALRLHRVDDSAFNYTSNVPTFPSGAAAAAHGLANVVTPDTDALRLIAGLQKKRRVG